MVDRRDVVDDPVLDLCAGFLRRDDTRFGRGGDRVPAELRSGERLSDFLDERDVAVEVRAARRPRVGVDVRAGLHHLQIQHLLEKLAALARPVVDVALLDLAADRELPEPIAAGRVEVHHGGRDRIKPREAGKATPRLLLKPGTYWRTEVRRHRTRTNQ